MFDEQKKKTISENIKKYSEERIKAIDLQKEGLKLLNPFEVGFGAWVHSEDKDVDYNYGVRDGKSLVLRPFGYLSGIFPTAGLIIEGVGSLKRIYNAIRLKNEKNRASALGSKYM